MIAQREKQVRNRSGRLGNGRFAAGASGNPKGRPKIGASLAELIRDELDRPERGGRTRKQRLAEVIVERALAGDHRFCRLILERTEPATPDNEPGLSADEWIRCVRIAADIPYQSKKSRESAQRLVDAIDAHERESAAEAEGDIEADKQPLDATPYRVRITAENYQSPH